MKFSVNKSKGTKNLNKFRIWLGDGDESGKILLR